MGYFGGDEDASRLLTAPPPGPGLTVNKEEKIKLNQPAWTSRTPWRTPLFFFLSLWERSKARQTEYLVSGEILGGKR